MAGVDVELPRQGGQVGPGADLGLVPLPHTHQLDQAPWMDRKKDKIGRYIELDIDRIIEQYTNRDSYRLCKTNISIIPNVVIIILQFRREGGKVLSAPSLELHTPPL